MTAERRRIPGSDLPPDRSPISAYPEKCCVLIDAGDEVAWHLISILIGGGGSPFVRRMARPPESRDWNEAMGEVRSVSEHTVVYAATWPNRGSVTSDGAGGEVDPFARESPAKKQARAVRRSA